MKNDESKLKIPPRSKTAAEIYIKQKECPTPHKRLNHLPPEQFATPNQSHGLRLTRDYHSPGDILTGASSPLSDLTQDEEEEDRFNNTTPDLLNTISNLSSTSQRMGFGREHLLTPTKKKSSSLSTEYQDKINNVKYQQLIDPNEKSQALQDMNDITIAYFNDLILKTKPLNEEIALTYIDIKKFYQRVISEYNGIISQLNQINEDEHIHEESQIDTIKQYQKDLTEKIDEIDELKKIIQENESNVTSLGQRVDEIQNQYEQALAENESIQIDLTTAQFQKKHLQERFDQQIKSIQEMENLLETHKSQLKTQEILLKKYEEEGAGFRPMYFKEQAKVNTLQAALSELEAKMNDMVEKQVTTDAQTQTEDMTNTKESMKKQTKKPVKGRKREQTMSTKKPNLSLITENPNDSNINAGSKVLNASNLSLTAPTSPMDPVGNASLNSKSSSSQFSLSLQKDISQPVLSYEDSILSSNESFTLDKIDESKKETSGILKNNSKTDLTKSKMARGSNSNPNVTIIIPNNDNNNINHNSSTNNLISNNSSNSNLNSPTNSTTNSNLNSSTNSTTNSNLISPTNSNLNSPTNSNFNSPTNSNRNSPTNSNKNSPTNSNSNININIKDNNNNTVTFNTEISNDSANQDNFPKTIKPVSGHRRENISLSKSSPTVSYLHLLKSQSNLDSLSKVSENINDFPEQLDIPSIMTCFYRLLPLSITSSVLNTLPRSSLRNGINFKEKAFNWLVNQIFSFYQGLIDSEFTENSKTVEELLMEHLDIINKIHTLSVQSFNMIIDNALFYSSKSVIADFFLRFWNNNYSTNDFKIFSLLFQLSIHRLYPPVEITLQDYSLQPHKVEFIIPRNYALKIHKQFFQVEHPEDLPRPFDIMTLEEPPEDENEVYLPFWDFADSIIHMFQRCHIQFHQQVQTLLKLSGLKNFIDEKKTITENLFNNFCILIDPNSDNEDIKKKWNRFNLNLSIENIDAIGTNNFIRFCSDFPILANGILILPFYSHFDEVYKNLSEPKQKLLELVKKKMIYFSRVIVKLSKSTKFSNKDIIPRLKMILSKIRDSLLHCDISNCLSYYRHLLQYLDLKLTEERPFIILPDNFPTEVSDKLIELLKYRESLTQTLLTDFSIE